RQTSRALMSMELEKMANQTVGKRLVLSYICQDLTAGPADDPEPDCCGDAVRTTARSTSLAGMRSMPYGVWANPIPSCHWD
ncbi:MAG: hypothetical protein ACC645_04590, partial [Pirellulales bacterium]